MENKITVVLADANEEFRELLCRSIEETGEFTVVGSAGDGLTALRLIEEKKPRLLLSDVLLPELDGFGLLDRIAPMEDKPRTILVSALYRDEIVAQAMKREV